MKQQPHQSLMTIDGHLDNKDNKATCTGLEDVEDELYEQHLRRL